ncbi:MAG: hypothetical protein JW739_06685 [Opitutales bacterium]|nr:hypothetical protein [Opitutales bacterium]
MRRIISFLMMVVLFSACASTKSSQETPRESVSVFERRLQRVVDLQERVFDEMQQEVDQNRVNSGYLMQRIQELAAEYESIIADNPKDPVPMILYGKMLRSVGDEEGAHLIFMEANEADPEIAVVKQQLGNYYAEKGRCFEALSLYLDAIRLEPDVAVYSYGLGELLHEYQREFLAEDIFQIDVLERNMMKAFSDAARLEPDNHDFRMRYGEAFYDLSNPDWIEALSVWEAFQKDADPGIETQATYLHRGRCLAALERFDEAEQLVRQVQEPLLIHTRDMLLQQIANRQPLFSGSAQSVEKETPVETTGAESVTIENAEVIPAD